MSVTRSVGEVLSEHVTLEVEGIDRMYLNVYIPALQREAGVANSSGFTAAFSLPLSALMDPISKAFVAAIGTFAREEQIPVCCFARVSERTT